jgi:tRNA(Arg) A34 adenosine deaminase TadA
MTHEEFLREAIALSAEALEQEGTEPFGAVVVKDGVIVGRGLNHARATFDPTSHGETEAIRDACSNLGTLDLTGCTLYSSCEPCPLCVAAMTITGIERLYYAAGLDEANQAIKALPVDRRRPVDIGTLRSRCGTPVSAGSLPAQQLSAPDALDILRAWATRVTGT